MVTIIDGSTTVTSVETNLFSTVTGDKSYGCKIYLDPMDVGDSYIFRVYSYDATGAVEKKGYPTPRNGKATPDDQFLYFAPIFAHRYRVTAQKISGTDRTFHWERAEFA